MIYYIEHESPLGPLLIAASDRGLRGVYFEQHQHFDGKQDWQHAADHVLLNAAAHQFDEYFARRRTSFDLPLDIIGTAFQLAVWQELMKIPFGQTASYAQQAQRIGNPKAVRAVGAANGRNPVSIVVPCHRVIGTNGSATGYAGGLERKRYLLALEQIYSV
jgi:methylated-DNA-[protein]-cysteine S-methyltransferase